MRRVTPKSYPERTQILFDGVGRPWTRDGPNGSFNGQRRFQRAVDDLLNVVLERFSSGETAGRC